MLVRLLGSMTMLALAASAQAQSAPDAPDAPAKTGPALNWTRQPGAESCIASVELAARIEARVKRKIFVAAPEAIVAVEGYVAPDPKGGFRASIAMSDGQGVLYGSRELTAQGACSELTDGLVFVIAVTLRPEGGASGIELPENVASALDALFGAEPTEPDPQAFPSQLAAQATEVVAPKAEEPAVAKPEDHGPGLTFYLEALGAAHLGLQPVGSLGGGLGARLRIPGIGSLSAHGVLFVPTDRTVDDLNSERTSKASFTVRIASVGYCTPALWHSGSLMLESCASGRIGAISGRGAAFSDGGNAGSSSFGSIGLAARLAWLPSSALSVGVALGPELHVGRPEFNYLSESAAGDLETAEVHRATLIGAAAELSVGFALF